MKGKLISVLQSLAYVLGITIVLARTQCKYTQRKKFRKKNSGCHETKSFFHIYHQLKIYNTRYFLHCQQNTLIYYKYDTTRSKISCLPCGFRKREKKKEEEKNCETTQGYTQKENSLKRVACFPDPCNALQVSETQAIKRGARRMAKI